MGKQVQIVYSVVFSRLTLDFLQAPIYNVKLKKVTKDEVGFPSKVNGRTTDLCASTFREARPPHNFLECISTKINRLKGERK